MVRERIFHQLLHYLHELPSTPNFLPAKAVLNATILIVFSIGNAGKETWLRSDFFLGIASPERWCVQTTSNPGCLASCRHRKERNT